MDINKLEALERIADLKRQGVLTEEEFQSAKQRILDDETFDNDATSEFEELGDLEDGTKNEFKSQSFNFESWFKEQREKDEKKFFTVIGVIVAALIVTVVIFSSSGSQSEETYVMKFSTKVYAVTGTDAETGDCLRTEYRDVNSSTQISVLDDTGRIIGTSSLGKGSPSGEPYYFDDLKTREVIWRESCTYTFKVLSLPKSKFYSYKIGTRKSPIFSFSEMTRQGWQVNLTLGTNPNDEDERKKVKNQDSLFDYVGEECSIHLDPLCDFGS